MVSNEMGQQLSYPVFTSRHSIGLTFLSWSYHWLSGHEYFWNSNLGFCKTPKNPNTGANAHFFKKNYCSGYQEWQNFILNNKNEVENCSMYGGPLHQSTDDQIDADYALALKFASNRVPLIFCVESPQDPWYFLYKRTLDPIDNKPQSLSTQLIESYQSSNLSDFLKTYFNESLEKFNKDTWDIRELIALNCDYFKAERSYLDLVDRSVDHLYIDSRDLWYNGEECLQRIFTYIDKKISIDQLPQWRKAYSEWQSTQLKILQFNWYLPYIVESIVKNYNFDLDFLKLNLLQEGVIQGCLIKDHNLNLKCYGLEQFPSNTKDLHFLLEENTHNL